MIPLRATMPRIVKNPTSEPSEMMPSPNEKAASTPPTSAMGSVRNDRAASRPLRMDVSSRKKMPSAATLP